MKEYQPAWRMPVLQHFISDLEKSWNLLWYDYSCKTFLFYVLERETFVANVRFEITMLRNNAEYKKMDQLCQLYNL